MTYIFLTNKIAFYKGFNQMDRKNLTTLLVGIVIGIIIGYLSAVLIIDNGHKTPKEETSLKHPAMGDILKFAELKKEQLAENPGNVQLRKDLANIYFDLGRYEDAAEHYRKVLEVEPKNADIMSDLGVCYRRLGDPESALEQFRKATRLKPEHIIAWYNIAVINYYDLKKMDAAEGAIEKVLEIDPFYENAIKLKNKIREKRK